MNTLSQNNSRRYLAASEDGSLSLLLDIPADAELDGRFQAWDVEEQEWLLINGWMFHFELVTDYAALAAAISRQADTQLYDHADDEAFFAQNSYIKAAGVRERVLAERAIIRQAVIDILAAGHSININNGGDYNVFDRPISDLDKIMGEIMATDEEVLRVYDNALREGGKLGSILLGYGNEPWSVIANNSTALEPFLAGARALAEGLEEESV